LNNHLVRSAGEHGTLVEILRDRAQETPSRVVYTWSEAEGPESEITFGALDERVRSLAAALQREGCRGERVLLLIPHGLDYIVSFLASLYASAIPVPAYPPDVDRLHRSLPRLRSLVIDASPKIVLATPDVVTKRAAIASSLPMLTYAKWLTAHVGLPPEDWCDDGRSLDGIAFLQYTSGSTSDAKGVMVTHANLLANSKNMGRRLRFREDSVMVSWLPMFHDMGLILGVLHSIYNGHPSYLMSPLTFLQRPLRWLEAVSKQRGTISGAPNFAYDLCVQATSEEERARLDLRSWDVAYSGAEPIRVETIRRFAAAFAPSGFDARSFSPCYGLAEMTLIASGYESGITPDEWIVAADSEALSKGKFKPATAGRPSHAIVSTGIPVDGIRAIVVDPETRRSLIDGEVGEIWLAGPNVAKGYWGRPEPTKEIFEARVEGTGDGPFLRTGDLGFLRHGELYVCGRLKDVIIIRGLNHAPTDIERTVEESSPVLRVGCVAAFAVDRSADGGSDGEELLVIVQDLKGEFDVAGGPALAATIRERVVAAHGVDPYAIVLTRKGGVPKTSSGKIQRRACREAFLKGELPEAFTWRRPASVAPQGSTWSVDRRHRPIEKAESTVRAWLVEQVSRRAGIPSDAIDPRRPFAAYGLGSRDAVALSGDLERWLGRRIPPTIAYEYATINALARHLAVGDEVRSLAPSTRVFEERPPVAIVGLACRFPCAVNPEAYWRLLVEGQSGVAGELDARVARLGGVDCVPAGTPKQVALLPDVPDVRAFDAAFFGIAPREAVSLDPQQRILLELTWEALEHAAIPASDLDGSRTGVFVGISGSDFAAWGLRSDDFQVLGPYTGTGAAASVAAGRIAYTLGLRGPALRGRSSACGTGPMTRPCSVTVGRVPPPVASARSCRFGSATL
jgi:acyl-CoA synthetase (AMP-forming)/AMP-acid ligase II/acyl carrier protein